MYFQNLKSKKDNFFNITSNIPISHFTHVYTKWPVRTYETIHVPKYHHISMHENSKVDFVNVSSLLCPTPFYTQIRAQELCARMGPTQPLVSSSVLTRLPRPRGPRTATPGTVRDPQPRVGGQIATKSIGVPDFPMKVLTWIGNVQKSLQATSVFFNQNLGKKPQIRLKKLKFCSE